MSFVANASKVAHEVILWCALEESGIVKNVLGNIGLASAGSVGKEG